MKDNVLVHNHPSGSTFSEEDIAMLAHAKLSEIRAVGKEYTYVMKNRVGSKLTLFEFNSYYESAVYNEMDKVPLGQNRPTDFKHRVWSEFARLSGTTYERIENATDE